MKFFNNCNTIEEVKALYKKLAKEHHPDRGGDTETMQQVNTEYAFACATILKGENLNAAEMEQQIRLSEEYREVIEKIINLPNIIIEVVGNWIWVTGNTYAVKDHLKAANLQFAPKKKCWYYRAEEFKTKGSNKSLDEIRQKYGSETISGNKGSKALK